MRNLQSLDCHLISSRASHSRLPFWKGFVNLGIAGHTAMKPAWFCVYTHHEFEHWVQAAKKTKQTKKTGKDMKRQEGQVLSAKVEFIAPRFTLSHCSLAVSAALGYEPCLSFWLRFVWGLVGLFPVCRLVRISLSNQLKVTCA